MAKSSKSYYTFDYSCPYQEHLMMMLMSSTTPRTVVKVDACFAKLVLLESSAEVYLANAAAEVGWQLCW